MVVVHWLSVASIALSMAVGSRATTNTTAPATVTSSSSTSTASSSIAASTSLPPPSASSFQIDVVYPIANTAYNVTDYFPVVLALQNLRPAVEIAPLFLQYGLSLRIPASATAPAEEPWSAIWEFDITPENIDTFSNADGSPFLLVNAAPANVWFWHGTKKFTRPVIWSVTIFISIDNSNCSWGHWTSLDFTVEHSAPTPIRPVEDFPGAIDVCAQPLIAAQYNTTNITSCQDLVKVETTSSCVAKLNATAVSSVSSLASYIAFPTGIPTATTAITSSTTTMSSSTLCAQALMTARPQAPLLAAAGVLGGLHFFL